MLNIPLDLLLNVIIYVYDFSPRIFVFRVLSFLLTFPCDIFRFFFFFHEHSQTTIHYEKETIPFINCSF